MRHAPGAPRSRQRQPRALPLRSREHRRGGHLPRPPGPQRPAAAPGGRGLQGPDLRHRGHLRTAGTHAAGLRAHPGKGRRVGEPLAQPDRQAEHQAAVYPGRHRTRAQAAPADQPRQHRGGRSWRAGDLSQRRAHPRLVDRRSAIPRPGATAPPGVFRRPRQHLLAVDARALAAEPGRRGDARIHLWRSRSPRQQRHTGGTGGDSRPGAPRRRQRADPVVRRRPHPGPALLPRPLLPSTRARRRTPTSWRRSTPRCATCS